MTWVKSRNPMLLMFLLGFFVFALSLWDIICDEGWRQQILAGYMILIMLILALRWIRSEKKIVGEFVDSLTKNEKTLEEKLSHFKCPSCRSIFSAKKLWKNNKKPIKMICPNCGTVGIISGHNV